MDHILCIVSAFPPDKACGEISSKMCMKESMFVGDNRFVCINGGHVDVGSIVYTQDACIACAAAASY